MRQGSLGILEAAYHRGLLAKDTCKQLDILLGWLLEVWKCGDLKKIMWIRSICLARVSGKNSKDSGRGCPGGAVVKNPPAGLPWWRSG